MWLAISNDLTVWLAINNNLTIWLAINNNLAVGRKSQGINDTGFDEISLILRTQRQHSVTKVRWSFIFPLIGVFMSH